MLNLLFSNAYAQEAVATATKAAQKPNPIMSLAPFILIFVVFYFLMIRPQKKKMVEEQNMIKALGKGDEVYTKSGVLGTIVGMTDKIVTIEISEGVKMKIIRSQIGGLASKIFEEKKTK